MNIVARIGAAVLGMIGAANLTASIATIAPYAATAVLPVALVIVARQATAVSRSKPIDTEVAAMMP